MPKLTPAGNLAAVNVVDDSLMVGRAASACFSVSVKRTRKTVTVGSVLEASPALPVVGFRGTCMVLSNWKANVAAAEVTVPANTSINNDFFNINFPCYEILVKWLVNQIWRAKNSLVI